MVKALKGTFEVIDGKLDFICITEGVSFEEVEQGLIKLRDEINRQLNNKSKCPFNPNKEN